MAIDLYRLSVGTFQRQLANLELILQKAIAHCATNSIDEKVLLTARLRADMFDFTRQVQIACDFAKGAGARLAGVEVPRFEDVETSLAELGARVAATRAFLQALAAADFVEADTRTIVIPLRERTLRLSGDSYLVDYALPNFYFHYTTAYDLLRQAGVEIGKRDYLGEV